MLHSRFLKRQALAVRFLLPFGLTIFLLGCMGENKFEKELQLEVSAIKLSREVSEGGYQLISTEELKHLLDSGRSYQLIDTMPYEDSYKKNHVPTAKQFHFPIPPMTEWNNEKTAGKSQDDYLALLGPDKDKQIVVYCGFVKCTRSHNGAAWAVKLGYTNVFRYPGGIFAWKGANFKTDSAD